MHEEAEDLPKQKSYNTPPRNKPDLYPIKSADHQNHQNSLDSTHYAHSKSTPQKYLQQQHFIKNLLTILNYQKTRETFERQNKKNARSTNPEDSAEKIKLNQKEGSTLDASIEEILNQSKDYDEMLSFLKEVMPKEENSLGEKEEVDQSFFKKLQFRHLTNYNSIQRSIQELFSTTEKVTLPLYTTLEADLENRQVKLTAMDEQENICMIDKNHFLHVIKQSSAKVLKIEVSFKEKSVALKWINPEIILLLTIHSNIAFYHTNSDLKVIKEVKSQKDHLVAHQIHVIKKKLSTEVLLLLCTSNQLKIVKGDIKKDSIQIEKEILLNEFEPIRSLGMLFIEPDSLEQKMIEEQSHYTLLHLYGLSHNQRSVIKFDYTLDKAGIFWKAPKHFKIEQLSTSSCKQYLILLLADSLKGTQEIEQLDDLQASLEYQILKLNHKGCIMLRSNHSLNFKDFPLGFFDFSTKERFLEKILKMSLKMTPDWVRCFSWHNHIYYLSLKSGRIIYKYNHEGEDLKLYSVGPTNCIFFSNKKLLQLLSIKQKKKKKVKIEWSGILRSAQTLIQRLARMNGIPQNWLLILRSIRDHDLDIDDIL